MRDPIVIEPAGFDARAAWKDCDDEVERCGGLVDKDGRVNWRAAFSADPGCCSCPNCDEYYWNWGTLVQCIDCGFQFPPDWWPMYSFGVQAAWRVANQPPAMKDPVIRQSLDREHSKRMAHPYYRYGFEHPVDDPWGEHSRIAWKEVLSASSEPEADSK